jgi:hypothetical protein
MREKRACAMGEVSSDGGGEARENEEDAWQGKAEGQRRSSRGSVQYECANRPDELQPSR